MNVHFLFNGEECNRSTEPFHIETQKRFTDIINKAVESSDLIFPSNSSVTVNYDSNGKYINIEPKGFGLQYPNIIILLTKYFQ